MSSRGIARERMQFGLIDPRRRVICVIEAGSFEAALVVAKLDTCTVLHADIAPGLAIAVDEQSLMSRPEQQSYFALQADPRRDRKLYSGNALLYAFDVAGQNINVDPTKPLHLTWISGPQEVEAAIKEGFIERPEVLSYNGAVIWEWQPNPPRPEKMN